MVLRADFGLLGLLEQSVTTADCCLRIGFGHCSENTIAFAADREVLLTVQSQYGCFATGLAVEEANVA